MLASHVPREWTEVILVGHRLRNANWNFRAMLIMKHSVGCCGANAPECKHKNVHALKQTALHCYPPGNNITLSYIYKLDYKDVNLLKG